MTIADELNELAVAHGGTAQAGGISGALDALNDALSGKDEPKAQTIEGAIAELGQHIGGGSSVTVESLTATENKTYTAPEGKAYSPVTVNVPSTSATNHTTMPLVKQGDNGYEADDGTISSLYYFDGEFQQHSIEFTTSTYEYDDGEGTTFTTTAIVADLPVGYVFGALYSDTTDALPREEIASMAQDTSFIVLDSTEYGDAIVLLEHFQVNFG